MQSRCDCINEPRKNQVNTGEGEAIIRKVAFTDRIPCFQCGTRVQISCHQDSPLVVFAEDLAGRLRADRDFGGFEQIVAPNLLRSVPVYLTTSWDYTPNFTYFLVPRDISWKTKVIRVAAGCLSLSNWDGVFYVSRELKAGF